MERGKPESLVGKSSGKKGERETKKGKEEEAARERAVGGCCWGARQLVSSSASVAGRRRGRLDARAARR